MLKKLMAEGVGTFWLVFGGCGSAIYAAGVPGVGIGWLAGRGAGLWFDGFDHGLCGRVDFRRPF